MGISCSNTVTLAKDNQVSRSTPSTNGSISINTTASKTIQSASVWNPFSITRAEAEDLLQESDPGSFVFSYDMTSELFLSLSAGKYVCHHSVVTRDNSYYVGAKRFDTVGEVIGYFKDHPLGEITLKEEYKKPSLNTTNIQVKQHPDVLIQSPATASSSDVSSSENESRKVTLTQLPNQAPETSPAIRRYQHQRATVPVERIDEEEYDANNKTEMVERNNRANRTTNSSLRLPRNKIEPLPRKPLLRSEAIDQDQQESSSSGADREVPSSISLMPLIPQQDYQMRSSPLIS
ncbi:uncharacterized protein LOC116296547 [Actinia tenebrosa]|uniref:Uncharacterized protein LOC116296547 n=1 Tax=Actinia tenebrosa TaxID=6105 RepID=A0A6P8HYQ6_ACTTE|nr:uncharacterized protein LOC116296547 [Actinia tenebrosa]XP_031560441.1 uncharacterized protein LOC116296547 [Actinia tenebrosa]